jgi:TolB protein
MHTSYSFVSMFAATAFLIVVAPIESIAQQNGRIAYSSWEGSDYDIYVVDPATPDVSPVRLTTDGRFNSNPDWSPDGRKIVYDSWYEAGGPRIRVMDVDPSTDDSIVLTDPCSGNLDCYGDFQPAWSPDGTRIAFVSSRPNADGSPSWGYQLYVMDAMGEIGPLAQATRLTADPQEGEEGPQIQNSLVTWSPDGQRIAFVSTGRAGPNNSSCDLWMMDSYDRDGDGFGDNLERLTFDEGFNCDPFEDFTPKWSPNSSLIAFTSTRTGYFDIWLVNADDPNDLRNVTRTPDGYEDQPNWSPDGTQIIFRSPATGKYELYSLPAPPPEGAAATVRAAFFAARPRPKQLTFDGEAKQQPDWGAPSQKRGTRTLAVSKAEGGRVFSNPEGIACGKDCAGTFPTGATVVLTAKARPGYEFTGWTGPCLEGATPKICSVELTRSRSVRANFGGSGLLAP